MKIVCGVLIILLSTCTFADNSLKIAAFSQDPPSISPFDAAGPDAFFVVNAVFDSLMFVNAKGNLEFGLAYKHEKLSPTKHRLYLRKGIRFHNGEELTASSVKATFDMHLSPAVHSSRRYIFSSIKKVSVENKYQVIFETKNPDNLFLYRLVLFSGIVPESLIKKYGPKNVHKIMVGAGPFRFSKWVKGKQIELIKNTRYWKKGEPKADSLVLQVIPTEQWKSSILSGAVDVVPNLPGKDARLLAPEPNVRIIKRVVNASHWLLLNNRKSPLSDERVRRAINLAVNRDHLIEYAAYGNGTKLSSIDVTGESNSRRTLEFSYDPQKAKELLTEVGYKNGFTINGWVTDVSETIAKIISKQLSLIGIKLNYEVLSSQEYARKFQMVRVKEKTVPTGVDFIINLVGNPLGHIGFHILCLLHSDGIQSLTSDAKFDALTDSFMRAATDVEAQQKISEIDRYVFDHSLIVPTYQVRETVALRNNIALDEFSKDGNFIGMFITQIHKKESKQ